MSTPFFKINYQIQAPEVRLLREDGSQIGVVSLSDALSQAKQAQVDAVEIAPLAKPPVVKLIDYKKFKYQLAKKEAAAKATTKKVDLKEIRLTPFMAANDYSTKINRGLEFLSQRHKLRVAIKFVGRQLGHKEFGNTLMTKVSSSLAGTAVIDQPPKWVGRQYLATFTPLKNGKTENQKISS